MAFVCVSSLICHSIHDHLPSASITTDGTRSSHTRPKETQAFDNEHLRKLGEQVIDLLESLPCDKVAPSRYVGDKLRLHSLTYSGGHNGWLAFGILDQLAAYRFIERVDLTKDPVRTIDILGRRGRMRGKVAYRSKVSPTSLPMESVRPYATLCSTPPRVKVPTSLPTSPPIDSLQPNDAMYSTPRSIKVVIHAPPKLLRKALRRPIAFSFPESEMLEGVNISQLLLDAANEARRV